MEDFKLIFYIAIAIAWAVYKNYQKVQQNRPKRVQPPVTGTEPLSDKKTLSDLIIEKARQEKKDVIRKAEFKKEIKAAERVKVSKPGFKDEIKRKTPVISPFLNTEIEQTVYSITDEKKQNVIETEFKKNSEEDLFDLKKFDIRTAIIYSEILKRPYA